MALLFSNGPKRYPKLSEQAAKIGECASAIFERALQEGPLHDEANLRSLEQIVTTAQQLNQAPSKSQNRPR